MSNWQIVWRGPVLDATGYGNASREYALALDRYGFDVKIEQYSWDFSFEGMQQRKLKKLHHLINKPYAKNKKLMLINHTPPENIKDKHKYDLMMLCTVWETTRIPKRWNPIINGYHAVCVPCLQNIDAMKNSGVTVPIYLVPHGVDSDRFKPENKKYPLRGVDNKFVFVSIFDFQHRKNPEALFRAYWEEFSARDNVILVVKTYGDRHSHIRSQIKKYKEMLRIRRETAPVHMIYGVINEKKLLGIYTLGQAFVLPTRGEGVGLPFMEALSSGIPVISTGWGGQMDFLNKKNAFLIDYKLRPPEISMKSKHAISTTYRTFKEKGQQWAEADVDHLKKLMRYAYNHSDRCKRKGQQGRKDMLQWSWEQAGLALKQAVEQLIH